MHLLPHLLASNLVAGDGDTAVDATFLLFSKAYDTVSRPFLYAVMEAMGAGDGLLFQQFPFAALALVRHLRDVAPPSQPPQVPAARPGGGAACSPAAAAGGSNLEPPVP
jgi:hypothetical protein